MLKHRSGLILTGVLSILFFFGVVLPAGAVECLSPSYSIQMGRDPLSDIEPRNLRGSEYQDLEELFQSLSGDWAGIGQLVSCEGPEDQIHKEIVNYTINSRGKMDHSGQFDLESTLYSPEKRTKQQDVIRLSLGKERLGTRPDIAVSDIELLSVSKNELIFLRRIRGRLYEGAFVNQETMISIKKTATALELEQLFFADGRLTSASTWQLERK